MAQSQEECGFVQPDHEVMEQYINELKSINDLVTIRSGEKYSIPVYFTIFRDDEGKEAGRNNQENVIDQQFINEALARVNEIFSPVGFNFFQLGKIQYLDNTFMSNLSVPYREFAYVSTALNIVIGGISNSGLTGSANMPNGFPANRNYSNTMWLKSGAELLSSTFPHELGHSFGLFHTFEGARLYDNPYDPLENVPTNMERHADNPDRNSGNFFKRELVIRENAADPSKPFPLYNWDVAGDFVGDTPASCATSAKTDFPDWSDMKCRSFSTMGNCYSGCLYDPEECVYIGNYVDYNGDTIQNAQIMIRNFMSYTGNCRSEFTPGQFKRMNYYYNIYRKRQYDANVRINLVDQVRIEDTELGLSNVVIHFKHQGNEGRHCNATTDANGNFQGIAYQELTTVQKINRIGKKGLMEYADEEWMDGVNMKDVMAILYHVYGYKKLNGYRQLAADIDADGAITLQDAISLRDIVQGKSELFTAYASPWQFVPEQVAEDHSADFHQDPFNMTLNGITYQRNAPYLKPNWVINTSEAFSESVGFNAFKIGDVDGSIAGSQNQTEGYSLMMANNFPEIANAIEDLGLTQTIEALNLIEQPVNFFNGETKMSCFPNPAIDHFEIVYMAGETFEGQLKINDRFGKLINTKSQLLLKGKNRIQINELDLPSGVYVITITGQEGTISSELVKLSL